MTDNDNILQVAMGQRTYDIIVEGELLANAGVHVRRLLTQKGTPNARVFIITDSHVAPHWLEVVERSLEAAALPFQSITIHAGEESKNFHMLEELIGQLLEARVERTHLLVALGGGVVGDLVGFAAAIVLRGIDFIQLPTTLLAQVDSAVGGKTGINTPHGKNLVGAFHQPRLVLADGNSLATLPTREIKAGYAEIIKYGLIADAEFFVWLENNGKAVLALEEKALSHAVLTSCRIKAHIVTRDEREGGVRALLNMGHTFAHALEAMCAYNARLRHGEAVGIGLVMALALSERKGLCPAGSKDRLVHHFRDLGLKHDLSDIADATWCAEKLLDLMGQDKKVQDGKRVFILAHNIGDACIRDDVDSTDVLAVLNTFL